MTIMYSGSEQRFAPRSWRHLAAARAETLGDRGLVVELLTKMGWGRRRIGKALRVSGNVISKCRRRNGIP